MDPQTTAPAGRLPELAYYYPEPYWLAREGAWIKSLLLFFDGVAILLPEYMRGREVAADPTLAGPLKEQGLLKILEPEWFVDQDLANRLTEGMVELISGGAFDPGKEQEFVSLSMSRMGYGSLSSSRMGASQSGVFEMIRDDLRDQGLALDSQDGKSIPLRRDVRLAYLMLLAQEARNAGERHGYDLQPTTSAHVQPAVRSFLDLGPMPSRESIINFDLATVTVDLELVPLDEVLDFRQQYRDEHRAYMLGLQRFVNEVSTADPGDRRRLFDQRQHELTEQAQSLTERAREAFKQPAAALGMGLGMTGAAWTLATEHPLPAALGALGALTSLLPGRATGSAYSYIIRAQRHWQM